MGDILKRHEKAIGNSGTDVIGKIHNQDDHIEQLKGYQAAEIYDKMRRSDTQVRKILMAIINPIKSATWTIDPVSEEDADLEQAALIEQILFKDINWSKFMNEVLTCVPHGYSMFEVVHQNKVSQEFGEYTGLAQLGFRRQPSIIEWCHDRITGQLIEVKQEAYGDIETSSYLPAEFLLIFYSEQEGDNIGFPLLRNVYGPYKRKLLATELQYIGIERFAIPTPIVQVPKTVKINDAEYKKGISVVRGFTSAEDSYIAYPEGWDLKLHNNVFDPQKINAVIKTENENMASAILASFLELGTGGNTGAYALSADLSDFFFSGLTYYASIITDTINNCLIPQLIKLNFGEDVTMYPKLKYSGITDNAGKELMEVITGFTGAGVVSKDEQLEDHVRKVFNLPKKSGGEMLENQQTQKDINEPIDGNDPDSDGGDDISLSDRQETLKLADLGHTHSGTGPSIQQGKSKKHYHEVLDDDGNVLGRTTSSEDGASHVHGNPDGTKTGKPVQTKELKEPKDNPKALIETNEVIVLDVIRRNLKAISDKYINDVVAKYKRLPKSEKLKAINDIKIGKVNNFKKELKISLTEASRQSLDLAKKDTGIDVKLSENKEDLLKEFDLGTFKFNDFSSLPKRIQLLIASQAGLIVDGEASSVADSVSFAFTSAEPRTSDINSIKAAMNQSADDYINSGSRDVVAANTTATVVNQTRNTYLFSEEVEAQVASYTFVNTDPKTDICQALAGSTFNGDDPDLTTYQPPLHHNCKSYIRANLKTTKNKPAVTGAPTISETARSSITLGEKK